MIQEKCDIVVSSRFQACAPPLGFQDEGEQEAAQEVKQAEKELIRYRHTKTRREQKDRKKLRVTENDRD